jgi:hypothetical protein
LAEDCFELLAEVQRIIDAVDVVLLAGDDGAVEYVLAMHGKARRFLSAAVSK